MFKPQSFIIVIENVAPSCFTLGPFDGQVIRNEGNIESIFKDVGLIIYDKTPQIILHENYLPVMAWALY